MKRPVISAVNLAFESSVTSRGNAVTICEGIGLSIISDNIEVIKGPAEISRRVFFGDASVVSATLGRIHPNLPVGAPHTSTSYALQSLADHLYPGERKIVPHILSKCSTGSAAILGGPVANFHARLMMGWNGPSPLLGVDLPITFGGGYSIKDEGWHVTVRGRSSQRDCLVITSLPLDQENDRLTNFAGLRPAGTRALKLLIQDERRLEKIYQATKGLTAWQVLIEVNASDDDTAKSLGDVTVAAIDGVDFSRLPVFRSQLLPDKIRTDELMNLLPAAFAPADQESSEIVHINNQELHNSRTRGRVRKEQQIGSDLNRQNLSIPGARKGRSGKGAAIEPQKKNGVCMNSAVSPRTAGIGDARPPRGRPPKPASETSLTRRLQILMSDLDIERLQRIMELKEVTSMGEVIRHAIRTEYEGLQQRNIIRKK